MELRAWPFRSIGSHLSVSLDVRSYKTKPDLSIQGGLYDQALSYALQRFLWASQGLLNSISLVRLDRASLARLQMI